MGKELPPLPEDYYDSKFLVKGCQSQVWLHASLNENGEMIIQADSDALIVKGLVALLIKVYSGLTPDKILKQPPQFIEELGFGQFLSPSRANGFLSMISDNVFVATVYIGEVKQALDSGQINRETFDLLAVAINTGTNIPSVATPNGQAAFLFLLTSALAPVINLSYARMVWMALPYTITMSITGLLAVIYLL